MGLSVPDRIELALSAFANVLGDVFLHSLPPVVFLYEVDGVVSAAVDDEGDVVECRYDVGAGVGVIGNCQDAVSLVGVVHAEVLQKSMSLDACFEFVGTVTSLYTGKEGEVRRGGVGSGRRLVFRFLSLGRGFDTGWHVMFWGGGK